MSDTNTPESWRCTQCGWTFAGSSEAGMPAEVQAHMDSHRTIGSSFADQVRAAAKSPLLSADTAARITAAAAVLGDYQRERAMWLAGALESFRMGEHAERLAEELKSVLDAIVREMA